MNKIKIYLFIKILISITTLTFVASCSRVFDSDEEIEDYFSLKIGQSWKYHISESELDMSRTSFPEEFTVSVIGKQTIENKNCYMVKNYFVPGPELSDTIFVRCSSKKVYFRLDPEQEELLFYSFIPLDTTWSVPMYANPNTLYPHKAHLLALSRNKATITWDWNGRSEGRWKEIFELRRGRIEIVSVSQAFGRVVWKLDNKR